MGYSAQLGAQHKLCEEIFVGSVQVAETIDAFVDAGLLERNKNPAHAARLYVLLLDGPQAGGLTTLLQKASTRQGWLDILNVLNAKRSRTEAGSVQENRKLHAIA